MKKIILSIVLCILFAPVIAPAHETKVTGPLSILLHMEPQDSPIVGKAAELFTAFSDVNGTFLLEHCHCEIKILSGKTVLLEQTLTPTDGVYGSNVARTEFTFPQKGIYVVSVSGNVSDDANELPFMVSYNVRIERESSNDRPVDPLVPGIKISIANIVYGFGAIIALAILFIGLYPARYKK